MADAMTSTGEVKEDPSMSLSGYAPALHFCPHVAANITAVQQDEELKCEPGLPSSLVPDIRR
jgi:hypothetical protein